MAPCHFTASSGVSFKCHLLNLSNDAIYSFLHSLCKVLHILNPRMYDKYDMTCALFRYTL